MNLKQLFILIFFFFFTSSLFAQYEKSVVRISSMINDYDYTTPWEKPKRKSIVGSGVVIANNYILTAAHVVLNARTIEIKKSNERKRYYASIKYLSPQADLALLQLYDDSFFNGMIPLKLQHSKPNETINVSGFPMATTQLATKKGTIAKHKQHFYELSDESLNALELDINIQEGFSGGAVINTNNELVAIAMQVSQGKKAKAYGVPTLIIRNFLEDINDGQVDGFYSSANSYQLLQNSQQQAYYKIKTPAILVTNIDSEEANLLKDDIIVAVEGKKISVASTDDFLSLLQSQPVGKSITLSVLRNNQPIKLNYKLQKAKKLLAQEFLKEPRYFVFGGLVFAPLTRNYLRFIGMKQYEINMLFYGQQRSKEVQERVVWLEKKFHLDINRGYVSKVEMVKMVNGIAVQNFEHFVSLIEKSPQKYIVIDFVKKQRIILDKEEAIKSFKSIQKQYKLPSSKRL